MVVQKDQKKKEDLELGVDQEEDQDQDQDLDQGLDLKDQEDK